MPRSPSPAPASSPRFARKTRKMSYQHTSNPKRVPIFTQLTVHQVPPSTHCPERNSTSQHSVKSKKTRRVSFDTAHSINSDPESGFEFEHRSSLAQKELSFRHSVDEIMDRFDKRHQGSLGVEEVQVLLDRCFGKGQFEARRVLQVLVGKSRATSGDLYGLFKIWQEMERELHCH